MKNYLRDLNVRLQAVIFMVIVGIIALILTLFHPILFIITGKNVPLKFINWIEKRIDKLD